MATIQIQVQDDVVERLGIERIKQLMQRKIDAEELRLAAEHIKQAVDEATGIDWEAELEQARQQSGMSTSKKEGWRE